MIQLPRRKLLTAGVASLAMPHIARAERASLLGRHPSFGNTRTAPLGPITVNMQHPMARGLMAVFIPGVASGLNDMMGINPALKPNNTSGGTTPQFLSPSPTGIGVTGQQGIGPCGLTSVSEPTALEFTAAATLGWVGMQVGGSASNTSNMVGMTKTTGSVWMYNMAHSTGGALDIFWATATGTAGVSVGATMTTGLPSAAACSFPWGGTGSCYLNGVLSGSTYSVTGAPVYDATSRFEINSRQDNTALQPNVTTSAAFVWNRALTTPELIAFTLSPFDLIRPATLEERRQGSAAGASGRPIVIGD